MCLTYFGGYNKLLLCLNIHVFIIILMHSVLEELLSINSCPAYIACTKRQEEGVVKSFIQVYLSRIIHISSLRLLFFSHISGAFGEV